MDQKIYVQIENKSLIPFFDLEKDSYRELNLTTIKDYQRTAIVTLYTRDTAGLDVQRKQYTIRPIPKAKAGIPKIGLSTRKRGYRKVDIELSLNGRQILSDRLRLPGTGRRLLLMLLLLIITLLLGFGGYLLYSNLHADSGQSSPEQAQPVRTPPDRREPTTQAPIPPAAGTAEPGVLSKDDGPPSRVSAPPEDPRESPEKQETAAPPATAAQPREQLLYFAPDSAVLSRETENALNRLASDLQSHTDAEITITGHCAPHGTEKGRLELSQLRAERVADFLQQRGITVDAADIRGIGASKPVTMKPEEQHLNRRVEIVIENWE